MRRPVWASLLAGAGGGLAVAGFFATSWPWNLFSVPLLAAWVGLLGILARQRLRGAAGMLLFAGLVALLVGSGVAGLISTLP